MSTLKVDNIQDLSGQEKFDIVLGTAVTASGTSFDMTGIPTWANRVTASFAGLSTTGVSAWQLNMGTSVGIESAGYLGANTNLANGPAINAANFTAGINIVNTSSAGTTLHGTITFTRLTGNTWVFYGVLAFSDGAATVVVAGSKTLSGAFDRLRFATGNATTWDAGTVNISWE